MLFSKANQSIHKMKFCTNLFFVFLLFSKMTFSESSFSIRKRNFLSRGSERAIHVRPNASWLLATQPKRKQNKLGSVILTRKFEGGGVIVLYRNSVLTFHCWDEPGGSLRTLLFGCTVYCSNSHKLVTDSTGPLV